MRSSGKMSVVQFPLGTVKRYSLGFGAINPLTDWQTAVGSHTSPLPMDTAVAAAFDPPGGA